MSKKLNQKEVKRDPKRDKDGDKKSAWRENKKAKKELFYAITLQG